MLDTIGRATRQLGLTDEELFTAVSDFSSTAGQHASERGAVLEQICSVSKQRKEILSSGAIALCRQQIAALGAIANPPPPDRGRWQVFPLTLFSALIAEERKVSVTI